MAPRTKYDLNVFRKLVISGRTKNEIMTEMAIKNHPTFNSLKLKLMDEDGKYYKVKDKKTGLVKKEFNASIGKRNTLTLSSKMFEGTSYKPGDSFNLKITKNKIILTLVED